MSLYDLRYLLGTLIALGILESYNIPYSWYKYSPKVNISVVMYKVLCHLVGYFCSGLGKYRIFVRRI